MTEVPRRRGPPPFRRRGPPVSLPPPAMPTESQFALITKNLGIEPSWRGPSGWFGHELHYRRIDQMIDTVSAPANAQDCKKHGLTANEWHTVVSGVLAHAAFCYKCTIPYTEAEIELLIKLADVSGDRDCAN